MKQVLAALTIILTFHPSFTGQPDHYRVLVDRMSDIKTFVARIAEAPSGSLEVACKDQGKGVYFYINSNFYIGGDGRRRDDTRDLNLRIDGEPRLSIMTWYHDNYAETSATGYDQPRFADNLIKLKMALISYACVSAGKPNFRLMVASMI